MGVNALKAKALRYRKPALASMSYYDVFNGASEIYESCTEIAYNLTYDREQILTAFDGDEEELWEFELAFNILSDKAEKFYNVISDIFDYENIEQIYNDCTVALIGNHYNLVGFDEVEEDYFSLCNYEANLAKAEAGKRLMRRTKSDMICTIGRCIGILMSYYDLRNEYDLIAGALDVLKGNNQKTLEAIKQLEKAYEDLSKEDYYPYSGAMRDFEKALENVPQISWIC